MPDLETAQANVDAAWAAHDEVREPMRAELAELMRALEGVTGLQPGPGCDRVIDAFLDFATNHGDDFNRAREHRSTALNAQEVRDAALAELPPPDEPPPPAILEQLDPDSVRAWLRGASDNEVRTALSEVPNTDDQRGWATQLMRWGRADGNTAQVFAAINEFLTAANPAEIPEGRPTGGVGATSTYEQIPESASSDDEPITSAGGPSDTPPDGDDVLEWLDETQGPEADAEAPPAEEEASEPAPETPADG